MEKTVNKFGITAVVRTDEMIENQKAPGSYNLSN